MDVYDNLEEFTDPPNYDIEEGERSARRIAFYCELAKQVGGPALEIACGSGLVTIPVAAQGLEVTGVDLARPMLKHARMKAEARGLNIRWVEADARSLDLGATYRFIFLTGNAFQAFLRREDQEALLESVKRHLAPDGTFAFETRNPSGHDLRDQPQEEFEYSYTSVEGHPVSVSFTQRYDPIAQIMYWTSFRRGHDGIRDHRKETHIACRFTHPQELDALLHYNGFQTVQQFGNWDREALSASSPSIISICTAKSCVSLEFPAHSEAFHFWSETIGDWLMTIGAGRGKPGLAKNVLSEQFNLRSNKDSSWRLLNPTKPSTPKTGRICAHWRTAW